MEHGEYLKNVEKKLKKHFDIEKDYFYKDLKIDLFAKCFLRNERYIGSKKATIYAFENNEYCLVKHFQHLDQKNLKEYINYLKSSVNDLIIPHPEHMSSMITGVIVLDRACEKEVIDQIKKFKFHKSFAFGFKGWVDIRLVLVCLDMGHVITNKKGREIQKLYLLS